MTPSIQASIIIPTYNRAAYLIDGLKAVAAQTADASTFEVLVVDNNSTDNTRALVQVFSQAHPGLHIRYICETRQGASNARNRSVAEAQGEILCFLDDDSPPSPQWLATLVEGFADPAVGCVGGPALLDYRGQERPAWLQGDLQGLLSGYTLPYAEPTAVSSWDQFPLSCNLALRRHLFFDLGLFRTDLGRSGGEALAAEETELIDRVHKAGWKVVYLPQAIVHHIVAPERLQKSHLYQIGRGLAASYIILTSDRRPHRVARWFASDLWYATRMFVRLALAITHRKQLWFDDYMRFWIVAQRLPMRVQLLAKVRAAAADPSAQP